jgi:soluble lytic murein transglycosylase-like protein
MVMVESGFDPSSTSHSGAMGLGQLMPGTARWMGVNDAYDTTENLYGTVKLIRTHLNQHRRGKGDDLASLTLALAAYNAGVGAVSRAGGVPHYRETQAYVRKVIRLYFGLCGIRS